MSFPIYLRLGNIGTDLHMLFETLAYVVGYQLYRRLRQSFGDPISQDNRWWIIAMAAVGAVLGSEPFTYLRDLFTRINSHPHNRLDELLPDRWQARTISQPRPNLPLGLTPQRC